MAIQPIALPAQVVILALATHRGTLPADRQEGRQGESGYPHRQECRFCLCSDPLISFRTVLKIDKAMDASAAETRRCLHQCGGGYMGGADRPLGSAGHRMQPPAKEILEKIAAAGIVGMGGATFPTHVKLTPHPA